MIHLSLTAVRELHRIQSKQEGSPTWFRLKTGQGGCSPLSYEMEFVAAPLPEDERCECEGLQVAIDLDSLPYLEGLTLDYTEDLMGGSFRFHNPNAQQTCSCGNSFSVGGGKIDGGGN
jgi:iron-sulfur cluster assembly accessory protein